MSERKGRHQPSAYIAVPIKMEAYQDGCFFVPHKSSSGMMLLFGGRRPTPRELLKKFDQNFQSYDDEAVSALDKPHGILSFSGVFEGVLFEKSTPSSKTIS